MKTLNQHTGAFSRKEIIWLIIGIIIALLNVSCKPQRQLQRMTYPVTVIGISHGQYTNSITLRDAKGRILSTNDRTDLGRSLIHQYHIKDTIQ